MKPARLSFLGLFSIVLFVATSGFSFGVAVCEAEDEINDPLEGFNRGVFWFNERADRYFLEPVAEGYDFVTPDVVQKRVRNFFENVRMPINMLSDLTQLKGAQFAEHTGRFLINSTLGIGGLFDVAGEWGLEREYEDFGTALGYWGVGCGPYLVLPLIGPSCVRDLAGRGVDYFADPFTYVSVLGMNQAEENILFYSLRGLNVVQTRTDLLETARTAREGSVDFYVMLRNSYLQRRDGLIKDGGLEFEDEEEWQEERP